MTWRGWLALSAVVIIIGLSIWGLFERQQRWLLEDGKRVAEIDRLRSVASDANRRAGIFSARAQAHQKEIKQLEGELEKYKKWRKNRIKPKTLAECHKQLEGFDAAAAILERNLALEKLTVIAQKGQIVEADRRADNLEVAWEKERKRADGYRKVKKRDKMKKAFIGVGSGLAGGAIVAITVGATN